MRIRHNVIDNVMSLLLLKILLMTILIFSFLKRLVDAVIENEENKRKKLITFLFPTS